MDVNKHPDPYALETYPAEPDGFLIHAWTFQEAFTEQWRVLAEHVAAGGEIATAPCPAVGRFNPRHPRTAVFAVQQARRDALSMELTGTYDAQGILDRLQVNDGAGRRIREERALFLGGGFEPPADPGSARLHTTVTRLFTDGVVHDVHGGEYRPIHLETTELRLDGRVHLLGYHDHDLGLSLQGSYTVDVVAADFARPGSGALAVRMLWGDPSTIAGAVEAGQLGGEDQWAGIGLAGASRIMAEERHRIVYGGGRLRVVDHEQYGQSLWFCSADALPGYSIYQVVDTQGCPIGLIVDSSGVARYHYLDELGEEWAGPWPADAREFDPGRDEPGKPPMLYPPSVSA